MDWSMFLICQEKTRYLLECPLNTQASGDKSEPYRSFLNNVNIFRALDTLPVTINFGEHISVADLVQNRGAWHKSCYSKFSKEKVNRAYKKRDRDEPIESSTSQEKRA